MSNTSMDGRSLLIFILAPLLVSLLDASLFEIVLIAFPSEALHMPHAHIVLTLSSISIHLCICILISVIVMNRYSLVGNKTQKSQFLNFSW